MSNSNKGLRIGILMIGYNCVEHLKKVITPWLSVRSELPELVSDVKICFTYGIFEETAKLGFPQISPDGTMDVLKELKDRKILDHVFFTEGPQKENEMWNKNLLFLKSQGPDILIMLNADEIWTIEQIEKMLIFVNRNKLVDYFKVNFKNYCINYKTYVDDFIVPRIWRNKVHKGLKGSYKDDLMEWEDGKKDVQCSCLTIPRALCFVKHYSWVGSEEYLKRKVAFSSLRYGLCSYSWDEQNNCLKLNDEYYSKLNIPKPILYHE